MSLYDPTINAVSIRASPRVLHRDRDAGFNTSFGLKELLKGHRRVSVAAYPHTLSSSIFYASDKLPSNLERDPYVETEFVTVDPSAHDAQHSLVYQDDIFDIDMMGMSVAPFDVGFHNNNELLVYSLKSDKTKDDKSIESVPYIHFDPVDAEGSGSEPNRFIPIPATKSLFMSYDGTEEKDRKKQVFCRFFVMEIDQGMTSQTIKHSITGIGRLGNYAQKHSSSIPEFGIISPVLSMASEVGKRALHSYTKADKVLAVDFRFLLAEREKDASEGAGAPGHRHRAGDYLRVRCRNLRRASVLTFHFIERFLRPVALSLTFAILTFYHLHM